MKLKIGFLVALIALGSLLWFGCKETEADPTEMSFLLHWTAPNPNDGDIVGAKVNHYELRYSNSPINMVNWFDCQLVPAAQLPAPELPGGAQNMSAVILWESSRTIYFAIKSYDNAGNVSPLSNVYQTLSVDITGPDAIMDLGG